MSNEYPEVMAFRTRLQATGSDFLCVATLPAANVAVSFLGPFLGQTVLWSMTLFTLDHYRGYLVENSALHGSGLLLQPFIEIESGSEGVFPLKVGLALETIDEPVIRKTIVMMRNYKRLAVGKIEFGSLPA